MQAIKKQFEEVVAFLQANEGKKVASIMPTILEMCGKASAGGSVGNTVLKDDEGNVVAIYCYYHKKWEPVAEVEYGKKANTTSGLNTMCKEGVSNWTKQQREAKKAKEQLLDKVATSEISPNSIDSHLEAIEVERAKIVGHSSGIGFEHAEEVLNHLGL